MIKKRIIPTLLYKDFTLVKGVSFHSWRRVGSVMQAVKVYNMRGVDELAFFDITATTDGREPDFNLVDEFADECFMPLTVGGGIRDVEDIKHLLKCGADKVSINSAAVTNPEIVRNGAEKFGSQCIMVSIDAKKSDQNKYEVVTHSGTKPAGISPAKLAKEMECLGAGEIIITSVDNDGTMAGYDIELIKSVVDAVSIPVIASGGAGNFHHMKEAFCCGAPAAAAASIFHFTEMTPLEAKCFLKDSGINVRI
ncbi:MAG: imidazole glycerol phosphate synthase cyclase subunit [Phycisphaerae bacterium]